MVRVLSSVIGYLPDDHGWAKDPGEGGAWLDMGVHMFDALRWFTNSEVELVFAQIRDFGGLEHQRRSAMAEVVTEAAASSPSCWSAWSCRSPVSARRASGRSIGSDGIIESDSYGKVRLGRGDGWEDVYEMPSFALNADVYSPVRLEAFAAQVRGLRAARSRQAVDRASAGEDGRAAVEIVEAAARSSASGQAVRLPISAAELTPDAAPCGSPHRATLNPAEPGTSRAAATFPTFTVLADGSLLATYSIGIDQGQRRPDDRAPSLARRRRDVGSTAHAVRDDGRWAGADRSSMRRSRGSTAIA